MFVLVTYDVDTTTRAGAKRLRKVAKECVNYGQRVQNSVFECVLSEVQFTILRNLLLDTIDMQNDSVRFYHLGNNWTNKVEYIGKKTSFDMTDELIV